MNCDLSFFHAKREIFALVGSLPYPDTATRKYMLDGMVEDTKEVIELLTNTTKLEVDITNIN